MSVVEIIRRTYKPEIVKVLYIGESAPAGGSFFYSAYSILYEAILEAYKEVFPNCSDGQNFLRFFQRKGCYLEDLCHIPVNKMPIPQRKEERKKGIIPLSEKLKKLEPVAVIIVMQGIDEEVNQAIFLSEVHPLYINSTNFPFGKKNKEKCIDQNISVLEDLIELGVLL